ncbi:hypothetical protein CPT_Mater166 [Bacillus phage Mater]|uniref:Tail assembly chaperone n=1 Tax=Bacillus phage Mater TaxID=1540090 RepID=A0A0A0RUR8_9CAUD|nr:tail assembly chaperone [Bacillus phage Mater]AIW03323.1 hypothetical protein CPT_Mater166 [Bacillus phage Mater]
MISSSGLKTFDIKLKELGGLKALARTTYMRNLWGIMKTFEVLPTDPSFRELTNTQIDLMIYSLNEDHREMELARKGLAIDSEHYDTSFDDEVWNRDVGDWDVLRDGHDPNEIAKQVEELTRKEDLKNLASKFDSLEEYNDYLAAGGKTTRETEVEQYINKQIQAAEEKARMLSAAGGKSKLVDDQDRPEAGGLNDRLPDIDKAAIDKSIALFNSQDDDDFDEL